MARKNKKDIREIKNKLFVKVENLEKANYDYKKGLYNIIGDLLFTVQIITGTSDICNSSELITLEDYASYGLSEEDWYLYAMQNMLSQSPVVYGRWGDVEKDPHRGIRLADAGFISIPLPSDTMMFYGNTVLFNAVSLLFLSPWDINIGTVAQDFGTDLFVLPVSAGFCCIISTENEFIDAKRIYNFFDEISSGNGLSKYIYIYAKDKEEFMLLNRPE